VELDEEDYAALGYARTEGEAEGLLGLVDFAHDRDAGVDGFGFRAFSQTHAIWNSPEAKARQKRYRKTEQGKAVHAAGAARYAKTENGKAKRKAWRESANGQALKRAAAKRFWKSPAGKATTKRKWVQEKARRQAVIAYLVALRIYSDYDAAHAYTSLDCQRCVEAFSAAA
jgi:hypothetical protein